MPVPTLARMARSSESWNKSENIYFCYSTLLPIPSGTLSKASVSLPPLPQAYSEFGIVAFCCKLSREVNSCLCSALSVKSTLVKKPYASTLFISVTEILTVFPVETEHLMFVSKRYLTETCTVLCCSIWDLNPTLPSVYFFPKNIKIMCGLLACSKPLPVNAIPLCSSLWCSDKSLMILTKKIQRDYFITLLFLSDQTIQSIPSCWRSPLVVFLCCFFLMLLLNKTLKIKRDLK